MVDKKERHFFLLPEFEKEEEYLMEMAKKGYLLEKVSITGKYYFKKSNPANMIYRIDFNPDKDFESYIQMYKDYGWEYIQDLNGFSYFRKVNDGTENEIFNDIESKIDMIEKISNRRMLPIIIIFLCTVIPNVIRMTINETFTDTVSIIFYAFWIVLLVVYIYTITRCTIGFNKLREKYNIKK